METTNKIDYKALCEAPFDMDSTYEVNFRMLVYTGRKEEERPVFRVVIAKGECKVCIGAACKEFWGIVGLDPETGESQWYNYNDCVSLENWAVLDRLLAKRFGWMEKMDPGLVYETKVLAKAQLAEG
ncbi:MAG: hypothetical protein J6K31_08035 [Parabacteroides sp.]|nr:hypothetical protein [Parabacteroides sp.]